MAVVGVILVIIILAVISPDAVRIILSVPVVLFLPGFALTVILFPQKSLGVLERLLLSVALSVAIVALSGLLLNLTPWGLEARTLWIALLLMVAVEIIVIFFTRRTWWMDAMAFPRNINFNTRQWVLMALAATMTVMAVYIARTPAPQKGLEGYTLLSAQAGDTTDTLRLSVRSEEFKQTKYQIKYQFNGTDREGPTLELSPGETWEQAVSIPVDKLAGKSFTVLLYRLDNPTQVYRHVDWWPEVH